MIEPDAVATALVAPSAARVPADIVARIPRGFLRRHAVLPQLDDEGPAIYAGPETDAAAGHNLAVAWGVTAPLRTWPDVDELRRIIDEAYEAGTSGHRDDAGIEAQATADAGPGRLDLLLRAAERDLLSTDGKAPVVQLVDGMIFEGLRCGASDLHLQPMADHLVVRHRIDGELQAVRRLPLNLLSPIVGRVKVLTGMDVSEQLIPQDGRATVRIGERSCDVRASTLPTPHGERLVLRLLDAANQLQVFADIGMPSELARTYLAAASRSSGIILITGPTGSGKTTTLYATLRELNGHRRNIMTIEDPIEYELDALGLPISQSQVNPRKGVTFANGLRHLLRQDPDVILIGEIRDAETARIAIQASLTGHLVLSTLHTIDAPSAVTRLMDLGIEPYLVAASLSQVVAQRLVRIQCTGCRGRSAEATCIRCGGTGYKGRRGIFELMAITPTIRDLVSKAATLQELRTAAMGAGLRTLAEAGEALVADGTTTRDEVERVVHG